MSRRKDSKINLETSTFREITIALPNAEWKMLVSELTIATRKAFTSIYRWRQGKNCPDYTCAQKVAEVLSAKYNKNITAETLFPDRTW